MLALLLTGCGVARLDESLGRAVMQNNDLATVEAGLPSYLLMVDGLIVNWPERSGLLMTGADLYGAYAGVFVDDEARAARLNEKALAYALRGACAHDGDYCDLRDIEVPAFEALLDEAELSRVRLLMERLVALDEDYRYGQAHMYLGVLNSILPASLGGRPEQARDHFERAVALSDGRNLLARVLFAEHYARLVFDRELHDEQLRQVLDAEPDVPDLTLQNTYAKEQAQQLLDGADDYF